MPVRVGADIIGAVGEDSIDLEGIGGFGDDEARVGDERDVDLGASYGEGADIADDVKVDLGSGGREMLACGWVSGSSQFCGLLGAGGLVSLFLCR